MHAAWLALVAAFFCVDASADLVVIANPQAGIAQLSHDELINIYLGRYRSLPSGLVAEPLDLPVEHVARARFYQRLVGKSVAEINAYWARLVFSGRTRPPRVVMDYAEAIRVVRENIGALAYVEESRLESGVKVIYAFRD